MSNKTTFTVEGIAKLDISQVKGAVDQMKKGFQGITLPTGIDGRIAKIFSQMTDEIAEFEVKSKSATTNADWSRVLSSGQKIMTLYQRLQGQIRQLGDLSEKEMQELFPPEVVANIKKAETALKDYQAATKKNTAEIQKQENELAKLQQRMAKKQGKKQQVESQTAVSNAEYKNLQTQQKALGDAAVEAANKLEEARQKAEAYKNSMQNPQNAEKSSTYRNLVKDVAAAEQAYQTASRASKDFDAQMANTTSVTKQQQTLDGLEQELKDIQQAMDAAQTEIQSLGQGNTDALNNLFNALSQIKGVDMTNVPHTLEGVQMVIDQLNAQGLTEVAQRLEQIKSIAEGAQSSFQGFRQKIDETNDSLDDMASMKSQVDQLKNSFMHFFSLTSGWMLLRRGIRQAYEAVKELDDAMTEIAVVSEYTLDDIWAKRDEYTKAASDIGASTLDLVNATKLYVQQGMDLVEAQEVGIETTKMARIANLDGAEATNLMTAALRGFNMEMSEANRVNDVYSQLAAKSAADTEEIATAMSKTASIAANAGASFENTSAFLTQIIETTREAPETAGTALKTIIARFQELKKAPSEIGEVDGEMVDANKIETALKTAGVELRNAQGEFRNFDDVIIELAGKWDSLDVMTQRYIATMAAGSRQQSRFIALMADSERLMELTGYAANSAGASNDQFNKTLDSLEAKINKLKNAWSLYLQNLANNQIIKSVVDMLTLLLETVNKITSAMPGFTGSILQAILTFAAFKAAGALINKAFGAIGTMLFKQGQNAGMQYSTGVQSGLIKGQAGIKNILKKIRALFTKEKWISKGYTIKFKADPKALVPYKNAMEAVNKAQAKYNATAASTTATNKAKKKSENELTAALASRDLALKAMGISEAEYSALQGLGLAQGELEVALTNKDVRAKLLKIAATKGLSDEEKKAAIAQALINTQQQMGLLTQAKYLIALLFGSKATRQQALDALAAAGAMGLYTTADGTATGAQWALNAAIYACPLGWLLVLILAVVAALSILAVAIANAIETDAEKMERLTKEAEDAQKALDKTQKAYKELQDELNNYKDLRNGLTEMVEGTDEWNQQLEKVNKQVMSLVNLYPQLAKYLTVTDSGEMVLGAEGMVALEKAGRDSVAYAQAANFDTQIALTQEKQNQLWDTTFGRMENFMDMGAYENGYSFFGDEETQNKFIQKWATAQGRAEMRAAFASEQHAIVRSDGPGGQYYYDQYGNPYEDSGYNSKFFGKDTYKDSLGIYASDEMIKLAKEFNVKAEALWAVQDYLTQWLDQWYVLDAEIKSYSKALGKQILQSIDTADAYEEGLSQTIGNLYMNNQEVLDKVKEDAVDSDFANDSGDQSGGLMSKYSIPSTGSEEGNLRAIYKYLYNAEAEEGMTIEQLSSAISTAEKTRAVQDEIVNLQNLMFKDSQLASIITLDLDATTEYNTEGLTDFQKAVVNEATKIIEEKREDIKDYLTTFYSPQQEYSEDEIINEANDKVSKAKEKLEYAKTNEGKQSYENELRISMPHLSYNEEDRKYIEESYQNYIADLKKDLIEATNEAMDIVQDDAEGKMFALTDELGYSVFQRAQTLTEQMTNNFGHLGADAGSIFSQFLYKNKSYEEIKDQLNKIDDSWDFSSSIAAAATFRDMLASTDEEIKELGKNLKANDAGFSNLTNQFIELTNAINSETLKELNEDGAITYQEVISLSKSVPQLATVLEDSTISISGMGKALKMYQEGTITADKLTGDFIRTLMRLDAVANMVDDAFGFIDTFKADRSTQEIGQYFSKMRESIKTAYEQGRYNDPQLISNIKAIVGEDAWDEATGSLKDKIEKFMPVIESFAENFYSFWKLPNGQKDGFITQLSDGSLQMDLSQFNSVEEVLQHIQQVYGVTKDVANAALTDFSTYSEEVNSGLAMLEQLGALQSMVEGADYSVELGSFLIDENELKKYAEALGIALDEVKQQIIDQNKDKNFIFDVLIGDDKQFTEGGAKKILEGVTPGDKTSLVTAMNQAYNLAIELDLDDTEARAAIANLFSEANNTFKNMNFGFLQEDLNAALSNLAISTTTGIQTGVSNDENFAKLADLSDAQQRNMFTSTFTAITSAIAAAIQTLANTNTTITKQFGLLGFTTTSTEEVPLISMKDKAGNQMSPKAIAEQYRADAFNIADSIIKETEKKNNTKSQGNPTIDLNSLKAQVAELLKTTSYSNPNSHLKGGSGFKTSTSTGTKSDTWKEDYDWLYNLEKKIAKTIRERNKLESEYNLLLTKGNVTQKALLENLRKQEALENKQLSQLEEERTKRQAEAKALQKEFSDVSKYVSWNSKEQRVVIDEGKMRADQDSLTSEFGERIDKAVKEFERIQDELEQIEDDTNDIKTTQAERLREQLDQYAELESRVIDALVSEREKEIEAMEKMNDVISEANSELLDKIQTGIDDARNAREMEEAEADIQDMEQRLALMRSDTSGANALDILKLEEELQQARQDLMDSKIDQAIDELSRQNEIAQKQREVQIERASEQLEVDKETGRIANQANKMLTNMVVKGGSKSIEDLLKSQDSWKSLGAEQKKQWVDELTTQITGAIIGRSKGYAVSKTNKKGDTITFTDKNNKQQKGTLQADGTIKVGNTTYSNVFLGADGKYYQKAEGKIMNTSKPAESKPVVPQSNTSNGTTDVTDLVKKRVALAIWNNASGHGWGNGDARKNKLQEVFGSQNAKAIQSQVNRGWRVLQKEAGSFKYSDYSYTNMKSKNWKKYETGGLADFTGPAWLDGTKARPEYVLNAEQTQAFLKLVNMLGDFDDNQTAGGNNYYDIKIEVDELANDYDVEQLMDKMKRLIADDAAYRNVNSIDLGRR